jgi:hypothetical protein
MSSRVHALRHWLRVSASAQAGSGSALNDDPSSSHGVAMAMRDLPLALFAAVYLRCP